MSVNPEVTQGVELLRGHRQIASFLGVSEATLDKIFAARVIPFCRLTGSERGQIVVTKRMLLEAIEEHTEKQMAALQARRESRGKNK
jgi:hypothetical protein